MWPNIGPKNSEKNLIFQNFEKMWPKDWAQKFSKKFSKFSKILKKFLKKILKILKNAYFCRNKQFLALEQNPKILKKILKILKALRIFF